MPRSATYPTLFDECKSISIADLKRLKYLLPESFLGGTISWTRLGEKTGSIGIRVYTDTDFPYVELDYKCNGEPIKYRINLEQQTSNLGKGIVWYFNCPQTGKRCRKLHLVQGYFFHRTAFRGCFYEKQVESKYWRFLDRSALGREFKLESLLEKRHKKYFKTHYAGKPTKRFTRLNRDANNLGISDI